MKDQIKAALLDAQEQLRLAQEEEERTQEAMDSMERRYWEGQVDVFGYVLALLEKEGK